MRNPVVAGQFYPGTASQLKKIIKQMVDDKTAREEVIGLVSPHAGYIYSGPVTGAVISRVKFRDTFVIIGPNHTGLGKPFSIMTEGSWKTPLGEVKIDSELGKKILAGSRYLREDAAAHAREHSIEVQLPFLQYFRSDVSIVPILLSPATGDVYREIGREIAGAVRELNREVVIMASSDMTHYEPQESAQQKDDSAIEAVLALDENELLRRVDELNISMCGYAPVVSLITAARELGATGAELVKYQTSGDTTGDYSAVVGYAGIIITGKEPHPLVELARKAVTAYITDGEVISPPDELTPEMLEQAGVFVSIHKSGGLRGCIGTFEPAGENVAEEIIANAISSATKDPRFPPVAPGELADLEYGVDVLTKPEPVADKDQLDPRKYGVIVESGWQRGLLLPDLEGVDSVDYQIDICRQKAGIGPSKPAKLYRFEVKRYQ